MDGEHPWHLIFVYGSLKRGCDLHGELEQQQFLKNVASEPAFRLFDCGHYPGLVKVVAGGCSVKGELYRVTGTCLQRLDEVEGVAEECFVRRRISLVPPSDTLQVWAYLYQLDTAHLPDCGTEWPIDAAI